MIDQKDYIIAEPYLCACAILEMIIKKNSHSLINQIQIAEYFGLNVSKDYKGEINNRFYTTDDNLAGVIITEERLSNFFEDFSLPLKQVYIPINTVLDEYYLEAELENSSKSGYDVLLGISYGKLYNSIEKLNFGHMLLFDDILDGKVKAYDPGPLNHGLKEFNVDILYSSMRYKDSGFWKIINFK